MMRSASSVGALPLLLLLLPLLCAAFVQTSFRLHGRGVIIRNEAGFGNKLAPFRSRQDATRAGGGTTMGLFSLFSSGTKASPCQYETSRWKLLVGTNRTSIGRLD